MSSDRVTGVITKYFPNRGFGFISSPTCKDELYFHFTFIEGGEESELYKQLNIQTDIQVPVTFIIRSNFGKLQATNIRIYQAGLEESPIAIIEEFLRSPRSTLENANTEFWEMTDFTKLGFLEQNTDLRKLVITRITKSTPTWEKLVDLANHWMDLFNVISQRKIDKDSPLIVEEFVSGLTSILRLHTLADAELIENYLAVQVKLVKPKSPLRWIRQAEDVNLLIFTNARALRQCLQKDPGFVRNTNRNIKISVLLQENDINANDSFDFPTSKVALIRQREVINALLNTKSNDSVVLGQVLRSILPPHLMQPFEVGSEYSQIVFSGRDGYRDQILDSTDSNYAVYGGRKIGKSWFLKDICFHCTSVEYHDIYTPVYISLQGTFSIEDTIERISEKMLSSFKIPSSESINPIKRLLYYIRKIHENTGRKILLALDEVDDVLKMEGSSEFFGALRAYQQNNPGSIKFVFAGFKELMKKLLEQVTNFPLANLFGRNHFALSCLDKCELEKLIVNPLKSVGLEFSETEIVDTIYGLTSGHPYYTQAICQAIVDDMLKQNLFMLSAKNVSKIATIEFYSEVSDIFEDNLSNLQKLIGKVCSLDQRVYTEDEIKDALVRRFGIELNDRQIREELRILVACSVFIRSDSGYEPLMPLINKKYFGDKDDTTLALAWLEGLQ